MTAGAGDPAPVAAAAACLALAAIVVAWPGPGRRARRWRVLGPPPTRWKVGDRLIRSGRGRPGGAGGPATPFLLVAGAVVAAMVVGGAVAALVAAAYGTLAARALARRAGSRERSRARAVLLDLLSSAAADLRAGLPATTALAELTGPADPVATSGSPAGARDPLPAQARAAIRLAERTGAPLADVLERLEADGRATDRAGAAAAAQAAGARATGWLLAGLPVAGIGLGYGIGADPLPVLLRTPIGAACAVLAIALQLGGLAWTARIVRGGSGSPGTGRSPDAPTGPTTPAGSAGAATPPPGPVGEATPAGGARTGPRPALVFVGAGLAGLLVAVLVGGWFGLLAGAVTAAAAAAVLRRLEPAAVRNRRLAEATDLPLAADLLAVALRGGAPPDRAVQEVAAVLPGPLGDRLGRTGRMLALGAPPVEAWSELSPVLGAGRLVRITVRSAEHGGALADGLGRLAADLRADRAVAVDAAARRAGVWIVLPLGLCFLPAFVLAGLVPVIVAVLGDAF